MTFAYPLGLWLLLVLPLIVVVYLLRQERRRVEVSSLYLWTDLLATRSRRPRLASLRNLSLLLTLIAAALIAAASAGIAVELSGARGSEHLVVVIDTSTSMSAVVNGVSQIERARNRARERIGRARPESITLVTIGANPAVVRSKGAAIGEIATAVGAISADGGVLDPDISMQVIEQLVADDASVVVFTDLAGYRALTARRPTVPLDIEIVGPIASNAAITAFTLRPSPDGTPDTYASHAYASHAYAYVEVSNFGEERLATALELHADTNRIATFPIALDPGERRRVVTTVPAQAGVYHAKFVGHTDALAADDAAWIVPVRTSAVVQLVTPGNLFLETFLSIYPGLTVVTREQYDQSVRYDILVIDRVPAPVGVRGRAIAIATAFPDGPFIPDSRIELSQPLAMSDDHPLGRGIVSGRTTVRHALSGRLDPRATVVARSGSVPLIYEYRSGNRAIVGLTFALDDTDIGVQTAFPVLMSNAISRLIPTSTTDTVRLYRTGDTVEIPVRPGEEVVVIAPDGTPTRIRPRTNVASFDRTGQVGVYQVRGESFTSRFAVSVVSASESDIAGLEMVHTGSVPQGSLSGRLPAAGDPTERYPIWHLVAVL
ncbi:MAG: VWA domain-containing protein, partial [Spirochaetaceae bacterium]